MSTFEVVSGVWLPARETFFRPGAQPIPPPAFIQHREPIEGEEFLNWVADKLIAKLKP